MIKAFQNLTPDEQTLLFTTPALISLLAATKGGAINETKHADAVRLAHLKTHTADPLLIPYYNEVDRHFNQAFEALRKSYQPFDEAMHEKMRERLAESDALIKKLDRPFAIALHASLAGYAEHVRHAYKGVVLNFLFPYPLPGISG